MSDSTELAETIHLIRSAQGALLRYVMSLCPDRSAAEDILQGTNVVLLQKADQFTAGTSFKAWAFGIAHLQTLAHLKRRKRERQVGFSADLIERLARCLFATQRDRLRTASIDTGASWNEGDRIYRQ